MVHLHDKWTDWMSWSMFCLLYYCQASRSLTMSSSRLSVWQLQIMCMQASSYTEVREAWLATGSSHCVCVILVAKHVVCSWLSCYTVL